MRSSGVSPSWRKLEKAELNPPQLHTFHPMILAFFQNEVRALARRADIVAQIGKVDVAPDAVRRLDRLLFGQLRVFVEIRTRVAKHRFAQAQKALHVPALDDAFLGIQIDGKVEKVGHKHA